jgi:hypothetical protein
LAPSLPKVREIYFLQFQGRVRIFLIIGIVNIGIRKEAVMEMAKFRNKKEYQNIQYNKKKRVR